MELVRSGAQADENVAPALQLTKVTAAAYESAEQGRRVDLVEAVASKESV